MDINSECIYDTTPWKLFKEGEIQEVQGDINHKEQEIPESDTTYRFTQR